MGEGIMVRGGRFITPTDDIIVILQGAMITTDIRTDPDF